MSLLRRGLTALSLFAALAALAAPAAAAEAGPRIKRAAVDDGSEARVIVKYRSDSTLMRPLSAGASAPRPQHAAALGQRLGLALKDRWVLGSRTQSLSAQGITAAELAQRLAAQPDVEWAEPVKRKVISAALPNDPYYGANQTAITPTVGQWYLRAPDSTIVSAINAIGAWSLTTGSASITVAVLDTGVRFDHPDFVKSGGSSKLYAGYDFISHSVAEADGNGRDADASDPGDWSTASDSCGASSSSWHGTQTAGLIGAATDNSIGMASVGREVMIEPVRVLGKCGGFDDDIQAAMLWAAGLTSNPVANPHPAQVINMSLGSTGTCNAAGGNQGYVDVFNQLTAAGVTVVVAAGNDEGLAVGVPANCPGAIAVGGLRHVGTKVGFSDVGPEITISAPAGNCVNDTGTCLYPILTTTNSGTTVPATNTYSDGTNYSVGTSFSAPLVAGTVALMLSVDPTLTPAQIKAKLQSTARAFPTAAATGVAQCHAPNSQAQDECACTTTTCGAGMLDAGAAVASTVSSVGAPPLLAISPSSAAPSSGDTLTLTATAAPASGRTVVSYQWDIVSGSQLASFIGSNLGSTASLALSGAGDLVVMLTSVDDAGGKTAKTLGLTVQAAATGSGNSGSTSGSSGGGGGGAVSGGWLALLALAVAALARRR